MSEITERVATAAPTPGSVEMPGAVSRRLRRLARVGVAALALGSASTAALVPILVTSAAPAISVFVGYADNARAGGEFPNPWADSSRVIFDGCKAPVACAFDAGAVRVRNDGAAAVNIDHLSVHIGTCLYTWNGTTYPVSLPAGMSLVTTQRGDVGAAGCTGPDPVSFDSSDIPAARNCAPNGILPSVDITVDGVATSYVDSGQVLNTGGVDPAFCTGTDESTQWVPIGQGPCPGQALTLAPATQTHPVDTTATLSARFANACGSPLSDVLVRFAVSSGPNAGTTGSAFTDAAGDAGFTYSSVATGTDHVVASVTNAVGFTMSSNAVTATWIVEFAPGGGAFVVGDQSAALGGSVKFWGAQWAKDNSLSAGPAPRSFKGFADEPDAPSCGQTWTSDPGNSTPPPRAPLPGLMAVIVTSSAHQSGPEISGDIVAIVIVRTNAGYQPNPGHSATGTVVGIVCGHTTARPSAAGASRPHGAATAHPSGGASSGTPATVIAATGCPANVHSHGRVVLPKQACAHAGSVVAAGVAQGKRG